MKHVWVAHVYLRTEHNQIVTSRVNIETIMKPRLSRIGTTYLYDVVECLL